MITMNTMMTRGMRVVITDVAVCVLSLVKAFGAVFFPLRYRFIHLCTGGQTQPVQGHGEAHG